MKNRHTLPLAMLLALTLTQGTLAATQADAPRAPRMDPAQMTERMAERLELAPEQSASVQKINERFVADLQKQRERMDRARTEHDAAMRKLDTRRDAELKKVLNEEQYRKYTEQRSAQRQHWRDGRSRGMHRYHDCDRGARRQAPQTR